MKIKKINLFSTINFDIELDNNNQIKLYEVPFDDCGHCYPRKLITKAKLSNVKIEEIIHLLRKVKKLIS